MERLTKRTETGVAYLADPITLQSSLEDRGKVARMIDRLAAYEDTGLMPEEIKAFAEDVAFQFGYYYVKNNQLHLSTGGLSTLEWVFDILGWNDSHPCPELECEHEGCHSLADCGMNTKDGYKRVCSRHFKINEKDD